MHVIGMAILLLALFVVTLLCLPRRVWEYVLAGLFLFGIAWLLDFGWKGGPYP